MLDGRYLGGTVAAIAKPLPSWGGVGVGLADWHCFAINRPTPGPSPSGEGGLSGRQCRAQDPLDIAAHGLGNIRLAKARIHQRLDDQRLP